MTEQLIRVTVDLDLAEVVADRMWSWGVRGVEEFPADDGQVTLSTSVGNDRSAIARALSSLNPSWSWSVDTIDDEHADDWKRFAEPVRCRHDIVVVPAWYDGDVGADSDLIIRIEPGGAFGLGDHPTTRSSIRALADEIDRRRRRPEPRWSMLDVGCGSGALAVLAALRDVPFVRGIDIADAAVAATLDNAERNGVADQIHADATDLAKVPPADPSGYDLVIANILAPTLVSMADDLRRVLADDGTLIISGILSDGNGHGHRHVLDALAPLRPVSTIDDAGWATVTLRR
ncbi:MAG: 50S ribosomal protein L11 methyltransferase [Actinomycetota bacterium]